MSLTKPHLVIALSLSISVFAIGCAPQNPSLSAAKDAIAEYENMRAKTGQKHSHVEYCKNDIVKLTISSRGELNSRVVYVPRKSVIHFKNRDNSNTYPLGVRIVSNCLSKDASSNCHVNSKIWDINVSLVDTAQQHVKNSFSITRMEPTSKMNSGLYITKVREDARIDKNYQKDDVIYTNFLPSDSSGKINHPALYIDYNGNKFLRPDYKRCNWKVVTDEAIRTSRSSDCTDLSNWKIWVSEFDEISNKISKEGDFAYACEP